MAKTDAWGIEIGADAIKAVRLVADGDKARLVEYEFIPFKKVLTTPDINADEQIQLGLDNFLSKHDVSKCAVVASVPGHMAFARFAKLPPVEPKKIPDIVKFEAVQQIPFPIEQVEWDYQVFSQPDSPDVSVGIFAITKERIGTFLSHFKQANVTVDAVTLSPLAVFNALTYDLDIQPGGEGMIFMDIGTQSTDLIIAEGDALWLRTLPMGGNNFTEALVRAFKLSFSKAEKLKREAATSKHARHIFQAMRPVFDDLVQEVHRSIGHYLANNRDAKLAKLIGVGSTFKLPALQKFIKQHLQMDVERVEDYKRISVEGSGAAEFSEHALNMATAYGCALQGLGMGKVSANVMPLTTLKARSWKAKQPWIGAAAALVALATGAAVYSYYSTRHEQQVEANKTDPIVSQALGKAQQAKRAWDTAKGDDPRTEILNYRRLLDYRDLWPRIDEDIAAALRSIDTQPELFSGDPAKVAKIERGKRKRLYITHSVGYFYTPPQGQAPMTAEQLLQQATNTWGNAEPQWTPPVMVAAPVAQEGPQKPDAGASVAANSADGPRWIVVVVEGWSPSSETIDLIGDHFLKSLQDSKDKPGRPYSIILSKQESLKTKTATDEDVSEYVKQVLNPPAADAGAGTVTLPGVVTGAQPGTGTGRGMAVRGRQPTDPGAAGGVYTPPPPPPDAAQVLGVFGITDMNNALPKRSIEEMLHRDDTKFRIAWIVDIKKPEETRQPQGTTTRPATSVQAAAGGAAAPVSPSPVSAASPAGETRVAKSAEVRP